MKCLTHNIEVNYPCSSACPLYGDCIASFSREVKRRVRTNADHIRAMSDEELAGVCSGPEALEDNCIIDRETEAVNDISNLH